MDASSASPNDDSKASLEAIKRHQIRAFEYLTLALESDDNTDDLSRKQIAKDFYKKAIEELETGIKKEVVGAGDFVAEALEVQDRMKQNLEVARDRLAAVDFVRSNPSPRPKTLPSSAATGQPTVSEGNVGLSNVVRSPRPKTLPSSVAPTAHEKGNIAEPSDVEQDTREVESAFEKRILDEIIEEGEAVSFSNIAGQEQAIQAMKETVMLPMLRPEIFTGLRSPARGILLFGPPGNGKTLLAKALAHESSATFFGISSAALTSKWVGESEKMVRALFLVAKKKAPSVIFIDEIDSVLSKRDEGEHEASRRLKTQFLLEFDGVRSGDASQVIVIAATNRPFDLDDAVLRRFPKRIFVQLPSLNTRSHLLQKLLSKQGSPLNETEINNIAELTDGYSLSDLEALSKDAAMGPIREIPADQIQTIEMSMIRDIQLTDFMESLKRVRRSVALKSIDQLTKWNQDFGDVS